jgi:hypothetical protein
MSRSISLALCFSLIACGESLNGTDYFGEPMLTMSGEVISTSVVGERDGEIRIALLWNLPDDLVIESDNGAELETRTIINWSMTLYHPPSENMLYAVDGNENAAGFPVLYLDSDGSGTWNEEWILGGSRGGFVFYTSGDLQVPPDADFDESTLPVTGYNVVKPPSCQTSGPIPPPTVTPTNTVNLEVGDAFFDDLPDINCDGSLEEWDALCVYGCGALD